MFTLVAFTGDGVIITLKISYMYINACFFLEVESISTDKPRAS